MPYPIREKRELAPNTVMMQVYAPLATRKMRPGQFIIVRVTPNGERIPLSISGWDRDKGTIRIIVQAVGRTAYQSSGRGFSGGCGRSTWNPFPYRLLQDLCLNRRKLWDGRHDPYGKGVDREGQ